MQSVTDTFNKTWTVPQPQNPGDRFRFDRWLLEEMKKQGLDVLDLELRSGVTDRAISSYLHGEHSPTLRTLEKILSVLGKRIEIVDV